MKDRSMAAATLCVVSSLCAQEEPKGVPPMPNPKHDQHAALATLAGDWDFVIKMAAMPGVPGMEQASESKGTERGELICNGLWLKATITSTWQGAPFSGIWLAGYDPFQRKYSSYWVSSDASETGISTMAGTIDAKTSTWTWSGQSSQGPMRSTVVFYGADKSVETCYAKGPDGKEFLCMEMVRTRSKKPGVAEASAGPAPKLLPEHEVLHRGVGDWAAVVKCVAPGMPASEEKGEERVAAMCNGRWLWSDFRGQMMGQPFEGHAIIGYDPAKKAYLGVWIDSMSPTAALTSGSRDGKSGGFTMAGDCVCPEGKPMKIAETIEWKGDNARLVKMAFTSGGETATMEIAYERKPLKR